MQAPNAGEKKSRPVKEIVVIKNTYDYQRMKLDRLMKNPEKEIVIPSKPKEKSSTDTPDFVRNVMGSSAGAGSGEFHVYRHIRRREYARQKNIQVMSEKERKDEEYKQRLEANLKAAQAKTEKKRAKRLKKKAKKPDSGCKKPKSEPSCSESEEESQSDHDQTKDESSPDIQPQENQVENPNMSAPEK